MILSKFIAVRAYLESSGIAFADKKYIVSLFNELMRNPEITSERGREILGHKTDTATSVFRLFEHIGIIRKRFDETTKTIYYSFSSIGKDLLRNEEVGDNFVQPLTPFFLNWLPFKIFLKYIQETPGSTTESIRCDLGSQVSKHTGEITEFVSLKRVSKEGVDKPFNNFVIPNVLATIGKFLKLIYSKRKDGPFHLTPLGKYVSNSIDMQNFNFKRMHVDIDYEKLAFLDFIVKEDTNIIVISKEKEIDEIRTFISNLSNSKVFTFDSKIKYIISDFNAILTKNNAYWTISKKLFGFSIDPLKVLELNANIVNIV